MPKMWLYTTKNMTTFNHEITSDIPYVVQHQPKIWLRGVIFHINKKYDSQGSYSTVAKNMNVQSYVPHQPNMTPWNHIPH